MAEGSVDDAARNVPILHLAPRVHSIARTRLDQSLSQQALHLDL